MSTDEHSTKFAGKDMLDILNCETRRQADLTASKLGKIIQIKQQTLCSCKFTCKVRSLDFGWGMNPGESFFHDTWYDTRGVRKITATSFLWGNPIPSPSDIRCRTWPQIQGFTINQHGSKQSSTGNPSSKESFFSWPNFPTKVLCEFGLFYGLVLMESTVR